MPSWTGCIAKGLLRRHTYDLNKIKTKADWDALTPVQRLELTFEEQQSMDSAMCALPVCVDHDEEEKVCGGVQDSWLEGDQWWVTLNTNDTQFGQENNEKIELKLLTGLSLRHNVKARTPVELSLCKRGARPQTGIDFNRDTNLTNYIPSGVTKSILTSTGEEDFVVAASFSTFYPSPKMDSVVFRSDKPARSNAIQMGMETQMRYPTQQTRRPQQQQQQQTHRPQQQQQQSQARRPPQQQQQQQTRRAAVVHQPRVQATQLRRPVAVGVRRSIQTPTQAPRIQSTRQPVPNQQRTPVKKTATPVYADEPPLEEESDAYSQEAEQDVVEEEDVQEYDHGLLDQLEDRDSPIEQDPEVDDDDNREPVEPEGDEYAAEEELVEETELTEEEEVAEPVAPVRARKTLQQGLANDGINSLSTVTALIANKSIPSNKDKKRLAVASNNMLAQHTQQNAEIIRLKALNKKTLESHRKLEKEHAAVNNAMKSQMSTFVRNNHPNLKDVSNLDAPSTYDIQVAASHANTYGGQAATTVEEDDDADLGPAMRKMKQMLHKANGGKPTRSDFQPQVAASKNARSGGTLVQLGSRVKMTPENRHRLQHEGGWYTADMQPDTMAIMNAPTGLGVSRDTWAKSQNLPTENYFNSGTAAIGHNKKQRR